MADERDVTPGELSLTGLWELTEGDLALQQVGPVAEAAAKVGWFMGAAAVLHLLPKIYGIKPGSPAARLGADVVDQWRYEIARALGGFPFKSKDG